MKWVKKKNSLMQYSESPAFYGSTNKPSHKKAHKSVRNGNRKYTHALKDYNSLMIIT